MIQVLAAALLFAAAICGAHAASADEAVPSEGPKATATIEEMVRDIVKLFPRAEAPVLTSGDKVVRVGMGSAQGVRPGLPVYLTRKGGPILHPVTKAVLGTKEDELGQGVVRSVTENEAEVEITSLEVTRVIEGDTARLPTKRDSLLIVVLGKDYNELALDGVLGSLRDSNRFTLSGPSEVNPDRLRDEGFIEGLARDAGTEYVLFVSTAPTMGEGFTEISLRLVRGDASVMNESTETVAVSYEVFDERLMGIPLVMGERRDFFRLDDLPFRGVHMATGDVTGDGRPEVVVSDGKDIRLYRYTDGILRLLWTNRGVNGDAHLYLDVADLNGNGFGEIYVTNFQRGRMASFVIEYDGKQYYRIYGPSPLMFRVLEMPDGKERLLTTTMGANSPYSGIINEYAWKDGKLGKVGPAGLPDAIKDPYGFVIVDIVPEEDKLVQEKADGEGGPEPEPEIVYVDEYDYVRILDIDDGERIWISPDRYGGYDNFFETEKVDTVLPNTDPRGKVKGKLIVRRGPDGKPYVVVTKNIPMTYITQRFRGYSGAEIYALGWDGAAMTDVWVIRQVKGYLCDIAMGEILEPRRTDIMILTVPTFKLEKSGRELPIHSVTSITDLFEDRSSLLMYKVPLR